MAFKNIWFISDTHFGHTNCLKFKRLDGTPLRPFSSREEMDEYMIAKWNSVVRAGDRVWHLGDFALQEGKNHLTRYIARLQGIVAITVGNHDTINADFVDAFDKVVLWRGFKEFNFTATHMPLRLDGIRDGKFCVHGHTHNNCLSDPHYINVSVENINYTPVHLDEILQKTRT